MSVRADFREIPEGIVPFQLHSVERDRKGVGEQAVEDFIYSKTSHLGYIRDHRIRAGLSALTTSFPETLSIQVSLASRQQQCRLVHAFKPIP